jgi:hypothetical protein
MRDIDFSAVSEGDPQAFVERILKEVRFRELVELIAPGVASAHDVFDILRPLLTREKRIAWSELVPPGLSWQETVAALDSLGAKLDDCEAWSVESIRVAISGASNRDSSRSLAGSELLYRCVLFSEFRLPLINALWHLGHSECLARLDYASRNLTQMNLVG